MLDIRTLNIYTKHVISQGILITKPKDVRIRYPYIYTKHVISPGKLIKRKNKQTHYNIYNIYTTYTQHTQ